MRLIVRLGDASEYESFDSLQDVAEYLYEHKVDRPLRPCHGGFQAPGYNGHNYISLYWSEDALIWGEEKGWVKNEDMDMLRELTTEELAEIHQSLKEQFNDDHLDY